MGADGNKRRIDVMVSSTFKDLIDCRKAMIDAAQDLDLNLVGMEKNPAPNADLIDASLAMVDRADIYVGLLGLRYGDCPECTRRNPAEVSLTELEYNRAKELGIPRLMFEVGEDFEVPRKIVNMAMLEGDAGRHKREAFRARVMKDRIVEPFASVETLKTLAVRVLGREKAELERPAPTAPATPAMAVAPAALPTSADLHPLNSPYIMQRDLVGRRDELNRIDTWAQQPSGGMLLFQAIGGMGKSALTWHWAKDCALNARPDLRGRLWYSFYEQGTSLRDFLVRTVSHITRPAPEALRGKSSTELGHELRLALDHEPWLLVLDGLERVLVAYNRAGNGHMSDEETELAKDGLGLDRAARDCIRPEDDRLLATLAQAQRSKILASSRLLPTALTSDGERAISRVMHIALEGLSPPDGAQLLFEAGVTTNNAKEMQAFLSKTFACHPLSIQVIPGLMRKLTPIGRLDFDAWLKHPKGGRDSGLLTGNLRGRQNHILAVAFGALDEDEKMLLASLSIVTASLTREVIELLNPKRPTNPNRDEVSEDTDQSLWSAVRKLADHGLVQYDAISGALDLHPAVRHTAVAQLSGEARQDAGLRVADALTARAAVLFTEVESVAELQFALDRVRALSTGGQLRYAAMIYWSGVGKTLCRLGAWPEALELIQAWFPTGWDGEPPFFNDHILCSYLLNDAAIALSEIGQIAVGVNITERVLEIALLSRDFYGVHNALLNLATKNVMFGRRFSANKNLVLANKIAQLDNENKLIAFSQLGKALFWTDGGSLEQARACLAEAPAHPIGWSDENKYDENQYKAKRNWANLELVWRSGRLDNALAEKTLATLRQLKETRYELPVLWTIAIWHQTLGAHALAVDAFDSAISLSRRMGASSVASMEVGRARSLFAQGERDDAARIAAVAASSRQPPHITLAELYLDLGDYSAARCHVQKGYRHAWSDGPPYHHHWDLERCRKVLAELGEPEPDLPPFDPANHPALPFEAEVEALIAKTLAARKT